MKTYKSVMAMIKDLSSSKKFKRRTIKYIKERKLARTLSACLAVSGIDYCDMPDRLGWSAKKLDKFLNSKYKDMRQKDIVAFITSLSEWYN